MALVFVPRAGSAGLIATLQKWGAELAEVFGLGRFASTLNWGTSLTGATPLNVEQNLFFMRTSNCFVVNVPSSGWRLLSMFVHAATNTGVPLVGTLTVRVLSGPTTAGPFVTVFSQVIAGAPDIGGYWSTPALEFAAGTALRVVAIVEGAALPTTTPCFATLNFEDLN
jgi:hypothetical protein